MWPWGTSDFAESESLFCKRRREREKTHTRTHNYTKTRTERERERERERVVHRREMQDIKTHHPKRHFSSTFSWGGRRERGSQNCPFPFPPPPHNLCLLSCHRTCCQHVPFLCDHTERAGRRRKKSFFSSSCPDLDTRTHAQEEEEEEEEEEPYRVSFSSWFVDQCPSSCLDWCVRDQ